METPLIVDVFVINVLFGLFSGMVLFLLSTGLSIVLGLMGVSLI